MDLGHKYFFSDVHVMGHINCMYEVKGKTEDDLGILV